jgi:hypothetical protein
LHDLKTAVAIGNYYLKQQALLTVRERLREIGVARGLGSSWNPANPHWKQAEDVLAAAAMKQVNREFSNLEWLSQQWGALDDRDFSEQDIDRLLTHFKTDYGRKQIIIVDQTVAVHVQGALSFSGKLLYDVPGTERERNEMQRLYDDADRKMRFEISESPEGTQFALSPIGKRYFVNAVLNVSGMINRRLQEVAASLPDTVQQVSDQAQPAVEAFERGPQS